MKKSKTPQLGPTGRGYRSGDIYSFRTFPATEFSPRTTNRYAALKILGFKDEMSWVIYVVLDGVFDRHPNLGEASHLPWLVNRRSPYLTGPACQSTAVDWEIDLDDFHYVGSVDLSKGDLELASTCRVFGTWRGASSNAEGMWRLRNDPAAYEQELELYRQACDARAADERQRYEKRLKALTWEVLLAEQPFSRWDVHPPFPPPEFVAAARDRVQAAVLELQSLGSKPKKAQVRAVLKACVEWFNAKNREFGEVIETEEREDICTVLEELAFVARQRSLVDEIEGWRDW
jgi:hypothetical protein